MSSSGADRTSLVRRLIRRRYAGIAAADTSTLDGYARAVRAGYAGQTLARAPQPLAQRWSGCGPLAQWVDLEGGETVLDLGCGSGLDAWLMATAPTPPGRVIALDLTPELLAGLQGAAAPSALCPVAGDYEHLPLSDSSCDLVTANAAFNLVLDPAAAFREAARILVPGGRLQAWDLIRERDLPEELLADPMGHGASLGGVPRENELRAGLETAGFTDIVIDARRPFGPVVTVRIKARAPA